jgi:DNA-binding transcriptional ArsR family regulator
MAQERRAATEAELKALASPVRLRIIRLCSDVALTNKEIAGALARDPASVLHHVRTLVATGFLAAEGERRGARGAREVPYRSTGRSWELDLPDVPGSPRQSMLLLETWLDGVRRVGPDNLDSAVWAGLRLDPQEREEFDRRVRELIEEFRARGSDGEPWSLFLGLHRDDRPV